MRRTGAATRTRRDVDSDEGASTDMPESTKPGKPVTVGAVLVAVETLVAKALEPYLRLLREVLHLLDEVLRNEELRPLFFAIHEWATGDERLRKYRQRWELEGIAMTVAEAEYELICSVIASVSEQVDPAEHLLYVRSGKTRAK